MCPPQVRGQLMDLAGVTKVDVDFATKTATVTVDEKVAPEKVAGALSSPYAGSVKP